MSEGPPLRLRDDPAVARALRDELVRASTYTTPGYDLAAGLTKLEGTLGAGAGAGAGAGTGAKVLLGAALKGALLGLVVMGGASVLEDRSPDSDPAPSPPSVSLVAPASSPASADETPALRPRPLPSPPLEGSRPPASQAPVHPASARPPSLPPPPLPSVAAGAEAPGFSSAPLAPAGGGDTLAAEIQHLARLRALQDSDPAQALALAVEGNRRFPGGLFAQEREAIAVTALVRLGRTAEARARASAFLSAYPRSAFAERIENLTGLGDAR